MDSGLASVLRDLKRDFPLPRPVQVRTLDVVKFHDGSEIHGYATIRRDRFLIVIERHPDISVQIQTLWHEWTHCLIWPRCRRRHSQNFWRVYGQIYSHYQD